MVLTQYKLLEEIGDCKCHCFFLRKSNITQTTFYTLLYNNMAMEGNDLVVRG